MAVNGSSNKGRCSIFFPSTTKQTCTTPNSSVLFDGNVPTLTGLDGDMWASQLLTTNITANKAEITFDFTATQDYNGVERVEVVMFNCPEWRISVRLIQLFSATYTSGNRNFVTTISPTITSCDSLVRVCISHTVSSYRPVFTLVFHLPLTSNWVYLAEVAFYANGSICPPDTIITPLTTSSMTTMGNVTEIAVPSSDPTIVIISVVVATSIILIIVTIIVILILCKLSKHKNHKHNASTNTVLGGSYKTRQQHNPHSERGHASLCKETGGDGGGEDGGGEADPSHQIYNRLTHDTHNTGRQSQDTGMNSTLQGNYEMREYSTVSNYRQLHGVTGKEVSAANQSLPQLFYTQAANNSIKKDEDKDTTDPQEEWFPSAIYAQVDKKKKEKSPPQTPEPYTSLDQMYAQVDKKKREVSEDPPCESGDVYSVVNKPSAPEIPQKSQLLLKELH